jgi:hypothetical protein
MIFAFRQVHYPGIAFGTTESPAFANMMQIYPMTPSTEHLPSAQPFFHIQLIKASHGGYR